MRAARGEEGEPLRVLLWCWGRRGGGPRYTLEAARALNRLPSLKVHLSVSRQSEVIEETRSLGVPMYEVDTVEGHGSAVWRTLGVPWLARRFAEYLDANHIDVVLCSMAHPWSGAVAGHICSPRRPYVLTVHDALHGGYVGPGERHTADVVYTKLSVEIGRCVRVARGLSVGKYHHGGQHVRV